ncbi:hypothetical protein KAR91_10410, partial [Candidatus Pacearchaeota archaeon]|nr:hypothetical protein [Candidatus Pacearchaeota archaeon]
LLQEFQEIAEEKEWKLIAMPDRELGNCVTERCKTLLSINQMKETQGISSSIHILGTGNPLSALLYVACGAISFDGLEWCQSVIHPKSGHLLHLSQRRLLNCDCIACNAKKVSYHAATLAHNLFFYSDWVNEIKQKVRKGNLGEMLKTYISNDILIDIGIGGLHE